MTKVLIVDDDRLVRESMKAFLDQNGFDTETAADGDEALRIAAAQKIDIAVIDIYMPHKDGLETIMVLRKSGSNIRIIATTGASDHGDWSPLEWAKRLGANRVMQKPLNPNSLKNMIGELEGDAKGATH